MNKLVFGILLCFTSFSFGATVGKVESPEGMVALFLDDQWQCPKGAFKIELFDNVGLKIREGCWKGINDTVRVIFSDGGDYLIYANEVKWGSK